jgi:hypothetical protein
VPGEMGNELSGPAIIAGDRGDVLLPWQFAAQS